MKSLFFVGCLLVSWPLQAKIISSTAEHYVLQHQAESSLPPQALWQRLVQPSQWWHPDHTYSGDAQNLTLELHAGGLWREDWEENSVLHGSVLNVVNGTLLRLDAPFGPLQELAVKTVWTISIKPVEKEAPEKGSIVTFDEIANGSAISGLDELAKAVDYVKGEAIKRLVAPVN